MCHTSMSTRAMAIIRNSLKSGWEAFEQIHAIDPFLPVIVITARPGQYATAVAAGVGALIEKPLDLPFLLQTMEELIRESAQERLARTSGKNPNISYCPAPKEIAGDVLGQVIDPAKTIRQLQDPPSTAEGHGRRLGLARFCPAAETS